jgi:hypothetical protein
MRIFDASTLWKSRTLLRNLCVGAEPERLSIGIRIENESGPISLGSEPVENESISSREVGDVCDETSKDKRKIYRHKYYILNKDREKNYSRGHYLRNQETKKKSYRHYYLENLSEKRKANHEYYVRNKSNVKEYNRQYYARNSAYRSDLNHDYALRSVDNRREKNRLLYIRSKEFPETYVSRDAANKSWKSPELVRAHFEAIGKQLGISCHTDWYRISRVQLSNLGGMFS